MTENNFQIDSAAVTDRGLSEKRPQNEDSYLEMAERGLFVVADGVGGAQAGDVASQMAVEIIAEAFVNLKKSSDVEDVMRIAIERANTAIYQMSHDLPQLSSMATTIVALHIDGNIATIGHVGDSRLYRLDGKGFLYRETQDHSIVEEEVRAGRMTPAQAAHHPSRNVISRALGADSVVEVDMKTIMFEPRATFLLCSDGITRHVDDNELREILLSNENPSAVVQRLKEICYERGAEDNLTAVIATVNNQFARQGADVFETQPLADFDEATQATARKAVVGGDSISGEAEVIEAEETPTEPLKMPEQIENTETLESAETIEPVEKASPNNFSQSEQVLEVGENANSSNAAIVEKPSAESDAPSVAGVQAVAEKTEPVSTRVETVVEKRPQPAAVKAGSGFGRFLSALLFLLIGGVLGAGGYYFWAQNNRKAVEQSSVAQPTPTQPAATPMPYSSFEGARRAVDKNPQSYVETNVATPQKAEDLYLLGRAYLLTGKYAEAKKSFEEAKNKLAQADETNAKVLANEIAMGLAIINDPIASAAFARDVNAGNSNSQVQENFNVNSNSNSNSNGKSETANSNR